MTARSKGRSLALQLLYQNEVSGDSPADTLEQVASWPEKLSARQLKYARGLFAGVLRRRAEIDDMLRPLVAHYRLERLNTVDLCIMRIAVYEMLYGGDVPPKVAINEAIELARDFSSEDAPSFVNGVLDAFYHRHADAIPQAPRPDRGEENDSDPPQPSDSHG
ncbi:transcription antitermination factor NusB [bacterium]|nr:transcription antitermination factor NusB [bacterium]